MDRDNLYRPISVVRGHDSVPELNWILTGSYLFSAVGVRIVPLKTHDSKVRSF